jgi:hypothetical protein
MALVPHNLSHAKKILRNLYKMLASDH